MTSGKTTLGQPSQEQLLREFYATKGIDIDQRVPRTIRRITWEEKNRDHEHWHRELEAFLKQRNRPTPPDDHPLTRDLQ